MNKKEKEDYRCLYIHYKYNKNTKNMNTLLLYAYMSLLIACCFGVAKISIGANIASIIMFIFLGVAMIKWIKLFIYFNKNKHELKQKISEETINE